MFHFFVEENQVNENNGLVTIVGSDVNHIKNVLRMKPGEVVRISSDAGVDYICSIDTVGSDDVLLKIDEANVASMELPSKVYLFVGIPKGDRMETVIEKTVELGVHEIIPVEMKRCVVKIEPKKADKKRARWQEIARAAAKQSKRSIIPQIHDVMSFKEAKKYFDTMSLRMVPYENENGMDGTRKVMTELKDKDTIGVFIGPEGGFDEDEINELRENSTLVSLGRRILRTDTAPICTMSMIMMNLEM